MTLRGRAAKPPGPSVVPGPVVPPREPEVTRRPRLVEPAHGRRDRRLVQQFRVGPRFARRLRASRRRRRRASPSTRSPSARPSAPPRRRAGSTPSAGGSRSRSGAWRRPACARRCLLQASRGRDELVHRGASGYGSGNASCEQCLQVVRVQDRVLARPSRSPSAPSGEDVRVRADEHAEVAVERVHPADRVRAGRRRDGSVPSVVALDARRRAGTATSCSTTPTGPAPGPAAAVRRRERLVQVDVHDVEAHVAGPARPEDRVEVRAVAVDEPARVVDERRRSRSMSARRGRACSGS